MIVKDPITYIEALPVVATKDVAALKKAQQSYGDSWKKRGGVGAFMMLARKWDRLEKFLSELPARAKDFEAGASAYDIFRAVQVDSRAEGVIDDIRDLRRYLLLVEAELMANGTLPEEVLKDDPRWEELQKASAEGRIGSQTITREFSLPEQGTQWAICAHCGFVGLFHSPECPRVLATDGPLNLVQRIRGALARGYTDPFNRGKAIDHRLLIAQEHELLAELGIVISDGGSQHADQS